MTAGVDALLALLLQASQTAPVLAFPDPEPRRPRRLSGLPDPLLPRFEATPCRSISSRRPRADVLVWADAANESVGFTLGTLRGRRAGHFWARDSAEVADSGSTGAWSTPDSRRSPVELGWFVLGSMRMERDFVYARRHV